MEFNALNKIFNDIETIGVKFISIDNDFITIKLLNNEERYLITNDENILTEFRSLQRIINEVYEN